MPSPKPYRKFLLDMLEEVAEAIRDSEDNLWHHSEDGSSLKNHYLRLATWAQELDDRMKWYDDIKNSE